MRRPNKNVKYTYFQTVLYQVQTVHVHTCTVFSTGSKTLGRTVWGVRFAFPIDLRALAFIFLATQLIATVLIGEPSAPCLRYE